MSRSKKPAHQRIRIHFEDHGQDFCWWELEDSGDGYSYRIVDCGPFQARFWTKYRVAKDSVRVDKAPLVTRDQVTASNLKYRITRIERVKPAARRAA